MTEEQKVLVQTSFDKVIPISDAAAVLFYDQLFALDPSLRGLTQRIVSSAKKTPYSKE